LRDAQPTPNNQMSCVPRGADDLIAWRFMTDSVNPPMLSALG